MGPLKVSLHACSLKALPLIALALEPLSLQRARFTSSLIEASLGSLATQAYLCEATAGSRSPAAYPRNSELQFGLSRQSCFIDLEQLGFAPLHRVALLPKHSTCTLAGGESANTRKAETLQGKPLPKNKDLRYL